MPAPSVSILTRTSTVSPIWRTSALEERERVAALALVANARKETNTKVSSGIKFLINFILVYLLLSQTLHENTEVCKINFSVAIKVNAFPSFLIFRSPKRQEDAPVADVNFTIIIQVGHGEKYR